MTKLTNIVHQKYTTVDGVDIILQNHMSHDTTLVLQGLVGILRRYSVGTSTHRQTANKKEITRTVLESVCIYVVFWQ